MTTPPSDTSSGADGARLSSESGPSPSSSSDPVGPGPGYNGDMKAYCKSLESWLWKAYWQRECAVSAYFTALSTFYPHLMTFPPGGNGMPGPPAPNFQAQGQGFPPNGQNPNLPNININIYGQGQPVPPPAQAFNNNIGDAPNLNNNPANPNVRQVLLRGIRRAGNRVTFDFKVAPIWKRLMAECIDFFILLVVKIFVTLSIVDNFELIDLDSLDLDALHESGTLMDVAYSLTSELLLLELTHRIVVCFFEAYCLYKGGATPGKSLLGLRVLSCQEVYPVMVNPGDQFNNNINVGAFGSRILVSPGSFLTFPRALSRSVIKNFSLAFFFPICFTIFHFEHHRTLYDVAAKSIVVEIRP